MKKVICTVCTIFIHMIFAGITMGALSLLIQIAITGPLFSHIMNNYYSYKTCNLRGYNTDNWRTYATYPCVGNDLDIKITYNCTNKNCFEYLFTYGNQYYLAEVWLDFIQACVSAAGWAIFTAFIMMIYGIFYIRAEQKNAKNVKDDGLELAYIQVDQYGEPDKQLFVAQPLGRVYNHLDEYIEGQIEGQARL